ncbi:MAG: VgrG-related protein, partial [Anaerolineales bacterium]
MPENLRTQIKIKVGGSVHEDMLDDLIMAVVDTNLHLPAMCTVELFDDTLEWMDDPAIALGKPVEISFEGQPDPAETTDPDPVVLFKGEITSIEPRFNDDGKATMLFRAYDKSHRLHRGKKTRTFTEQTDSDIISKIANEAGLTPDVEKTSIKFPYLLQNNQTNMEFLLERARRIGYWAFATKEKLYFKKPDFTLPGGPTLLWCDDLREFRPRLSAVGQPKDASALGWDFKAKKEIEGKAATATVFNPAGITKTAGAAAEAAFTGKASVHIVNRHVIDPGDAKSIAQAALDEAASEYLQADGEAFGDATLVAGVQVTIKGVGERFEGKYLVTSATHVYQSGNYKTRFSMTGRQPNTLRYLLGNGRGTSIDRAPADMPGVVVGVVTNTDDKDGLGRVKVEFPWLGKADGAGIESSWARISAPMAGKNRGFMFMPAIKDEVLVAFEHGDPNAPYVLGGLWNTDDTAPLTKDESTKGG